MQTRDYPLNVGELAGRVGPADSGKAGVTDLSYLHIVFTEAAEVAMALGVPQGLAKHMQTLGPPTFDSDLGPRVRFTQVGGRRRSWFCFVCVWSVRSACEVCRARSPSDAALEHTARCAYDVLMYGACERRPIPPLFTHFNHESVRASRSTMPQATHLTRTHNPKKSHPGEARVARTGTPFHAMYTTSSGSTHRSPYTDT